MDLQMNYVIDKTLATPSSNLPHNQIHIYAYVSNMKFKDNLIK